MDPSRHRTTEPSLILQRRKILLSLWLPVVALLGGQILHLVSEYRHGNAISLFDFGAEANLPTFFNVLLLLGASQLLLGIGWLKRRAGGEFVRHWLALGLIFFFLAIDEAAGVHELIGQRLKDASGGSLPSRFHYAWSLLYLGAFLGVGFTYLRFLFHLPRRVGLWVIASGLIYVTGALGIEVAVGSRYAGLETATATGDLLFFDLIESAEELLELLGLLFFIRILLDYSVREFPGLRIELGSGEKESADTSYPSS